MRLIGLGGEGVAAFGSLLPLNVSFAGVGRGIGPPGHEQCLPGFRGTRRAATREGSPR
jgi:hypothetical protein